MPLPATVSHRSSSVHLKPSCLSSTSNLCPVKPSKPPHPLAVSILQSSSMCSKTRKSVEQKYKAHSFDTYSELQSGSKPEPGDLHQALFKPLTIPKKASKSFKKATK